MMMYRIAAYISWGLCCILLWMWVVRDIADRWPVALSVMGLYFALQFHDYADKAERR